METLVKADRFWHEVFLSRIVMQKKKFRQHKIDHDLYRKQKSVGGALIPKFMPHTKSHMASLCSVKITIAVYIPIY